MILNTRTLHGVQIHDQKTNSSAKCNASAMAGSGYKADSVKVVSLENNQHYLIRNRLNRRLRKLTGYHGFPITTKPYNASYKSPCWDNNGYFFCLPYFFLGGFPKCGTTELYSRLVRHPDIAKPGRKEPHWWTRARFAKRATRNYLQYVSPASKLMKNNPEQITVDASVSTIWDNSYLFPRFGDTKTPDPSVLMPHYIHLQLPQVRCIVILRDPVERLYSGYLWFDFLNNQSTTAANFHIAVKEAIGKFNMCLKNPKLSFLHCVYARLSRGDFLRQLRIGLYHIHLQTWLTAFSADQLMVVRLEDYSQNTAKVLQDIFKFLDVKHIPTEDFQGHNTTKTNYSYQNENDNAEAYNRAGQMLDETNKLLTDFYKPYNMKLAELLKDKHFLFNYT